jgi:hypothetical protein
MRATVIGVAFFQDTQFSIDNSGWPGEFC